MSAPGKSNQTVVTTAGSVTRCCHSCPRALPWPLAQPKCGGAAGASTHPGFRLILLLVHATQREDALEASPGLLPRFTFLSVTQSADTATFFFRRSLFAASRSPLGLVEFPRTQKYPLRIIAIGKENNYMCYCFSSL